MKTHRLSIPLIALIVALAFSPGCGASLPRIQPLPAHVEAVDANLTAATGNLQQLLTMAARAVDTVSKIEDEAARGGVIPTDVDAAFDKAMVAYANASDAASKGLTSGTLKTWPQLRALIEPVLAQGQQVIDVATNIGAIKSRVSSFLATLRDVLSAAAGEFLFGGAR